MTRLLAIIALLACTGCANMSKSEIAYHTLHAIDVAQTINHGSDPCYREATPMTRSLIGEHPDAGEVIAWGVASSLVHYYVSRKLEQHDAPRWARIGWQSINIGIKADAVVSNHRIGVRPWGDNVGGCNR